MKNGLHKINSFVTFAKIYDELYIQENKNKKDIIKFYGPTLMISGDNIRKIFQF